MVQDSLMQPGARCVPALVGSLSSEQGSFAVVQSTTLFSNLRQPVLISRRLIAQTSQSEKKIKKQDEKGDKLSPESRNLKLFYSPHQGMDGESDSEQQLVVEGQRRF